jgi:hypothetical protein
MPKGPRYHLLNHMLNNRFELRVRKHKKGGRAGNGVAGKTERDFQAGTRAVPQGKLHSQERTSKLQRYPFTYCRLHR